jgi:tRNA-specific 2-thiouridylase
MSGGVDSSVAAFLLREQGHDVVGVFMRNGVAGKDPSSAAAEKSCCSASDARDAAVVADRLGVPFYAIDYAEEFARLIDHFASEYRRGRTPNPCVLCNQHLKFGHLFDLADSVGADAVATGHYARVDENGRMRTATDAQKDQTYYLFGVARDALPRVHFPLGGMTKDEVRDHARRAGLRVADKPESMEICFVTSGDYRDIVHARGGGGRPGRFVDVSGRELGAHDGVDGFTIGQRRGLPALGVPHYVQRIDPESGDVVLARREDLGRDEALVRGTNWLVPEIRDRVRAGESVPADVKIRARSPAVRARLGLVEGPGTDDDAVLVRFEEPAFAVTPGQAAVFYDDDLVLGGGWID